MSTPVPVNVRVSKTHDERESWEEHLVLRVPPDVVERMNKVVNEDSDAEDIGISFCEDTRMVQLQLGHQILPAKLMDLPTITELHKTFDKRTLYKVGDISQLVMCDGAMAMSKEEKAEKNVIPSSDSTGDVQREGDESVKLEETGKPKSFRQIAREKAKEHTHPHGLTPVMKNAKKRRFRKKKEKKTMGVEETEEELKRLLRSDLEATSIRWEIVEVDGPDRQEDVEDVEDVDEDEEEEQVLDNIDDVDDGSDPEPENGDSDDEEEMNV